MRDLETILVSAGRSKALEFKNLRGDSGLRNSFLVNSDAAPGSLLATLSSRSDSRSGEVELLGKDEMDPTNGGNHPWSLEHGSDSTLLLFNHNTGPESFSVSISNGETTWQKIYELAPMQTEAISFRGLIQNRTKDDRGHTLPANVLSGQVTWFTRMPGVAKGRLLQSSPDTAMARSFSCAANAALCNLTFVPNTTTFSVGSTVTFGTAQTWICDVTGEPIGTCGSDGAAQTCPAAKCNYIWSPDSGTSISGPSNMPTVSLTGAAPGTSIVNANVTDRQTGCQRAIAPIATVKPTVTFTGGNNFIFEGSDPTVTICNSEQVQGTPTQGTFSWSAATTSSNHPNISFNGSPSPYSTSSDVVTVTGDAPSSSLLDTTLTVGYSVNNQSAQTPATRTITIRLFKFLQQSGNIQVVPINGQGNPPKWGYISYVYYSIFTNPGGQQLLPGCSNISVYESVSLTNSNFPSTTVETGTGNTSQNAQVIDTLTIKADNPLPADFSASADQYLGVGGFIVRHNTLSWSQSGPSITNLGPTS